MKRKRGMLLMFFLLIACAMNAVGEFIHEVIGHGLFVVLFGGQIVRVYISLLWPYELSTIGSIDLNFPQPILVLPRFSCEDFICNFVPVCFRRAGMGSRDYEKEQVKIDRSRWAIWLPMFVAIVGAAKEVVE